MTRSDLTAFLLVLGCAWLIVMVAFMLAQLAALR